MGRNADSRVDRGREVGLHPALRKPDQADAFRIHVGTRLQVIDQAKNVPDRVVKEWMSLPRSIRAKDRVRVLRRTRPGLRTRPAISSVDRHGEETLRRELPQKGLPLLTAPGAV